MIDILDEISELVYVTDIETYELLYMNQKGKDMFHVDSVKGLKCYEVLHGESSPCDFCMNCKLKENVDYTWEHYNKILHTHFRLKDRLIDWTNGKKVHLEIAFDINDQMEARKSLQTTVDNKQFLIDCMEGLYETENIQVAIQKVLKSIGVYLEAKKTTLVQLIDQDEINVTIYQDGQISEKTTTKMSEIDDMWHRILSNNGCTLIKSLDALDVEKKSFLHSLGIHSLIGFNMENKGGYDGYLIIENPHDLKVHTIEADFKALQYFIMLAVKRSQDSKLLTRLSYYDTLTHIGNRNLYMKDVVSMLGKTYPVGVVYIDMNGLKTINDKHGHLQGDKALIECTKVMKLAFASSNTEFYRVGGDEFIIITKHIKEIDFLACVMELKNSFEMNTSFKAAIGFSWSRKAQLITDLVSEADHKMYEDKKSFYRKPNISQRYRHYNDEILDLIQPNTLTSRLSNDLFTVYLQPKFSFADKELIGAEALIRYHANDGSIHAPGQFLPLLEDSNLISHIDLYVFECMCKKLAQWQNEHKKVVVISTNFSRFTLLKKDIVKEMVEIVDRYGVDRHLLEIEITETVEGLDWVNMIDLINDIRNAGFHVSIDDFGSHYANLSLFTSVEFNVLKIDKSLVDNIASNTKAQAVIKSIAEICQKMEIVVIVEGVETEEQFQILKHLGCAGVQGFLFSKPIPIEAFEATYLT